MENFWVPLVLLLGVAVASPTPQSYEQVLASAVATYNQESGLENAFRLLEAEPRPSWDPSAQSVQPLRFSIQETECRVESSSLERCAYKADGLIKDCTGYFPTEPGNAKIRVNCNNAAQKPARVTRFRALGILLRGFGKAFGRAFNQNQ